MNYKTTDVKNNFRLVNNNNNTEERRNGGSSNNNHTTIPEGRNIGSSRSDNYCITIHEALDSSIGVDIIAWDAETTNTTNNTSSSSTRTTTTTTTPTTITITITTIEWMK